MSEYIEKESLYQYLNNEFEWSNNQDRLGVLEIVTDFEMADVEPIIHGKWIGKPMCGNSICRCSICECVHSIHVNLEGKATQKYCPNCGSKMDLE